MTAVEHVINSLVVGKVYEVKLKERSVNTVTCLRERAFTKGFCPGTWTNKGTRLMEGTMV